MKKQLTIVTLLLFLSSANNYAGGFIEDFDNWVEESTKKTTEFVNKSKETKQNITQTFDAMKQEPETNKVTAIFETKKEDKWGIELNIPGYKKNEINITINKNGYINIKAEASKKAHKEKKDKDKNYLYKSSSFSSRSFSQTIKLPRNVNYKDASKIDTSYNEKTGILEIKFPKKEITKIKKDVIELKLK